MKLGEQVCLVLQGTGEKAKTKATKERERERERTESDAVMFGGMLSLHGPQLKCLQLRVMDETQILI